jgi:mono/diheme cytochrome c family protein
MTSHCLRRRPALLAAVLASATLIPSPAASAEPGEALARGRLLYDTHCIACHSREMHWRDKRLAADWVLLVAQVRDWQGRERLGWSDADVDAVALYLNETIYRYPRPKVVAAR